MKHLNEKQAAEAPREISIKVLIAFAGQQGEAGARASALLMPGPHPGYALTC